MSTLQVVFSMSSRSIRDDSSPRLQDLAELGLLTMLMLLTGQYPHPFDPCVLQVLIHDLNILSLHEDFVKDCHQSLGRLIREFITLGSSGDLSGNTELIAHFASYHGTDVSSSIHSSVRSVF